MAAIEAQPGGHRRRRDRFGEVDPAAEDLPEAGAWGARADRAHPAPPDRRALAGRADRRGDRHRTRRRWSATPSGSATTPGPDTMVKLMTDGILLAEITRDRELSRYDTIIIDEAHERSLNIDFLLGYLTELLPAASRPQGDHHLGHHRSASGSPGTSADAPIVEVSGRTYPVEVRYRPYGPAEEVRRWTTPDAGRPRPAAPAVDRRRTTSVDQATAICRAVDELAAEGDGDVLVFLSGEREITDTAEVLRGHLAGSPGSRRRGAAAVRPAVDRRPAPGVQRARRPANRAVHQRRRDLADRAGHPVRDRSRHRPHLALLHPDQGAAAADREDLPGLGRPAGRPVRAGRRRHLHPAVRRGRTSWPDRSSPTRRSPEPRWPR